MFPYRPVGVGQAPFTSWTMRLTMNSPHSAQTPVFSGPLVHEVRRHHPQSLSSHWLLCLLLPVSPCSDNSQVLQQDCAPWHLGFARRRHGGHLSFLPDNHLNLCLIFGKVPMKQSPLSLYTYKWSCHSSHQVVDPVLDHVTCFSQ